jgi:hypothetical protein
MRLGFVLAAAISAGAFAQGDDGLRRLESDPSPEAGATLSRLYHSTTDADQRFWLVQALARRVRDHSDLGSLDALLFAAQESDPGIRAPALRALTNFDRLPRDSIGEERLEKIGTVARVGASDNAAAVRNAARELENTLRIFKDPDTRTTPPPPDGHAAARASFWSFAARVLKWVWIIVFPFVGALWVWAGAPVFDLDSVEGRYASAAFRPLRNQYLFLALCGFLWLSLASLAGGYGFFAMALLLGTPLYEPPGSWMSFYLAAGFCVMMPASMAAAGFARRPRGSLLMSALRSFPWAVAFSFASLLIFAPLEAFYRLFFRAARRAPGARGVYETVLSVLDAGSFRTAHLAAAVAAKEGRGLISALPRALAMLPEDALRRRSGLSGIDPRFSLLCATPAMALLCSLVARGMPVRWEAGWPVIFIGCAVWAWTVLSTVLFALVQALSGVDAAARVLRENGGGLPDSFGGLEELYNEVTEDGERS